MFPSLPPSTKVIPHPKGAMLSGMLRYQEVVPHPGGHFVWHAVPGSGPPPRDGVLEPYPGRILAIGWGITLAGGGQYKRMVRQKFKFDVEKKKCHIFGPDLRTDNIT